MKKERKIFSLNLICYLRCNGFKEKKVGFNKNTKKVFFIYEEDEKLEKMIRKYKNRETMVKLHDFIAEFKTLKEEMYHYQKEFMKKDK